MTSQPDPKAPPASTAEVNIAIGKSIGSFTAGIINGDVNVSVDYQSKVVASKLGANPYKALEAFELHDAQRFFGRQQETQVLLRKLRELYARPNTVRVLPVYGPSGSGKSSLIRAGLVAILLKRGRKTGNTIRMTGLVPGSDPVHSLVRRLMQWQPAVDAETVKRWVKRLSQPNEQGQYDGLHRLISDIPGLSAAPLMILVDQFEEVFTQQDRTQGAITEQTIFIQNLLFAAANPTTRVIVVLTFRSDFLRETQDYPLLNQLCTEQGYLVPMLTRNGLREAIMKPAQMAG